MKRLLLISLLLAGCQPIDEKENIMIANCYTDTDQQFIEFELMPFEGEEMTREHGLKLIAQSLSEDGETWKCE